ncbi:hypothetical protein B0H21DRAFT_662752, partial [Amylocystis lapponica]
ISIKWLAYSCPFCKLCRKGLQQSTHLARYNGFTIDSTSKYVVFYVSHVTSAPDSLDSAEAASILCAISETPLANAGIVYRAIEYDNAHIGDWIALPGAGAGLDHLAVQYAIAMGLHVLAINTGAEKQALGTMHWIDFTQTCDLVADIKATLGPHAAVVTTVTGAVYAQVIDYLR